MTGNSSFLSSIRLFYGRHGGPEPPSPNAFPAIIHLNTPPVFEKYKGKARFVYAEGGHDYRHYELLFAEVRSIISVAPALSGKFSKVATEEGVQTLLRREDMLGGYDVLFEYWTNEGIGAVSAIFLKEDVAHLSDAEIVRLVQQECQTDQVLISRKNALYLFANYGFKELE